MIAAQKAAEAGARGKVPDPKEVNPDARYDSTLIPSMMLPARDDLVLNYRPPEELLDLEGLEESQRLRYEALREKQKWSAMEYKIYKELMAQTQKYLTSNGKKAYAEVCRGRKRWHAEE